MYSWLRAYFWGERAYLTYWYAFLFSFAFSWRKVIIPSVTGSSFNEYMDFSLYIGDILILSSLILIIKHNYSIKSILNKIVLFHVEHPIAVVLWAYLLISFFWSESSILWIDSILGILRIITILSLFVFSLKYDKSDANCSTWNNIKYFIFIFSLVVVFQSLLGLGQFITNHSLGIKFLGESVVSQYIPGVAKIDFDQYKQIRAYGTFLHPNIFGGYLVLSILFIYFYILQCRSKLFHVEQLWLIFSLVIGFIALFLTFSKGSIVSLIVGFALYLFHVEHKSIKKMSHVEQLLYIGGIIGLISVMLILGKYQILKSIQERVHLWDMNKPIGQEIYIGKGLGQSVYDVSFDSYLDFWKLQPIHNVYLHLINEIGVIGIGILIYLIFKFVINVPRGTILISLPIIGALGTLAMFDHYLWSTYVGQVLTALSLGFGLISSSVYIDIYNKKLHNINYN